MQDLVFVSFISELMREPKNPHIVSVEILAPRVRPTVETLFFGPKDGECICNCLLIYLLTIRKNKFSFIRYSLTIEILANIEVGTQAFRINFDITVMHVKKMILCPVSESLRLG